MGNRSDRLDDEADERGGYVHFRAPANMVAAIEAVATDEGISRSDVARRALLRELRRFGVAV